MAGGPLGVPSLSARPPIVMTRTIVTNSQNQGQCKVTQRAGEVCREAPKSCASPRQSHCQLMRQNYKQGESVAKGALPFPQRPRASAGRSNRTEDAFSEGVPSMGLPQRGKRLFLQPQEKSWNRHGRWVMETLESLFWRLGALQGALREDLFMILLR